MSNSIEKHETQAMIPLFGVCALLVALFILAIPIFVCSPVTSDTSLFDVQAMTVLKGGVLYRDVLEPNLPGIVWVHIAIRSIVGWSSEAIRVADLVIFAVTLLVLSSVIRGKSPNRKLPWLCILLCSLFYLSRNEWCHCQRDMWMMLPVSCALLMRFRRQNPGGFPAIAEGILWGIAFWLKPHIAIPALATLLVDCVRFSGWQSRATDLGLVVAGGIIAAVPGIAWLISTGAWEHFWEMMLNWNPEYLATGKTRRSWERLGFMFQRFYPWWIVHLVAVPVSIRNLIQLRGQRVASHRSAHLALCACYLAWLIQTFLIQHAMDYIHVPEVMLGICVLAWHPWQIALPVRRFSVVALLVLGIVSMPQLSSHRLKLWVACVTNGSTPEIRDTLAQGNFPNWRDLDAVAAFLAKQNAADGDVTCLNVHSIHILKQLQILPANRYWSVTHPLTMYPSRYHQIMTSVTACQHRYAVVEESEMAHEGQILPKTFPRQFPVVFEQGSYKVYAVQSAPKVALK